MQEVLFEEYHKKTLLDMKTNERENIVLTPGLWLTGKEFDNYKKEIIALEDKYINLSLKNRKANNLNAFRVSVLVNIISKWEPSIFSNIKGD